ncbi:MAG: hypothetical protein RLZZ456_39, partial [Pseudomonadota bacterium]
MSDRQGSGHQTVIDRADHGVSRKDISPNALR